MEAKKTYIMFLGLAGLFLFIAHTAQAFTSVSADNAYTALTATDSTAVMFDTRTVDEYYGCNQPWDANPVCPDPDPALDPDIAFSGTPTLKMIDKGVLGESDPKKLPFMVPWWITGDPGNNNLEPENPAEVREIIEELLATSAIDFSTEIYLLSRTGFRSYYMAQWMETQTFYNSRTGTSEYFTNLFNIDLDGDPANAQGGMQEWNVTTNTGADIDGDYSGLPIWRTSIIAAGEKPPQVFTLTPLNGYTVTGTSSTTCVNFTVTILEPSAGVNGPITSYGDVTKVCVGTLNVLKLSTDGTCIEIDTPADTVVNQYNLKMHLKNGTYIWAGAATNIRSNLGVLNSFSPNATHPGLDQRTLIVNASCTDMDCDGYAIEGGDCGPVDCDDTNAAAYPGAEEVCDNVDNNCDSFVDEGFDDIDGDGYAVCVDCNDNDASINPGAEEVCDGVDNDCDATTDEIDTDGDGFASCSGDCDDSDPAIYPGATEICNGIDDNCNGIVDDGFDTDSDGYSSCGGNDCDDTNAEINPGVQEICGDGIDNNCNGSTDEDLDNDSDGYTSCGGDCNDSDPDINPGAIEVYDGVDNDCDGVLDPAGNPPTVPVLVYPSNGQTGLETIITFKWAPSTDLDGDKITYDFLACEENLNFTDCKIESVAYLKSKSLYYAGTGFGLLMFAAALAGDRRKVMMLFAVVVMTSSMLFISCGSGGGGGDNADGYETYRGTGFTSNTTYRWKVVAKDGSGRETESSIRTFTTK